MKICRILLLPKLVGKAINKIEDRLAQWAFAHISRTYRF